MPVDPVLQRKLNQAVAKVRNILKISQDPMSLSTPVGDGDSTTYGDFIPDDTIAEPIDVASRELLREQIRSALDFLTERERQVLELRFGFGRWQRPYIGRSWQAIRCHPRAHSPDRSQHFA